MGGSISLLVTGKGVYAEQEDGPAEVANTCQLSQPPVIYRILLPVCRHKTLWPLKPLVEGSSPSGRTRLFLLRYRRESGIYFPLFLYL